MDIGLLKQYKDACALCKEIEKEIERLHMEEDEKVMDCVIGSDTQYPYTARRYIIAGMPQDDQAIKLSDKEKILLNQKAAALKMIADVDASLECLPVRMQRIVRYKFINGMTWERVADKMGGKCTGESLRKEWKRFLKNQNF